jgi:hypothetical protein
MRILVLLGPEFKDIDAQGVADATQERMWRNTLPPPEKEAGPGEEQKSEEGWAFFDADKEPENWSWQDYTIKVGTRETGRHEITETIVHTEDARSALIAAYDRFDAETDQGGSED